MNFKYWLNIKPSDVGISKEAKYETIGKMKEFWNEHFPDKPLFEG